MAGNCKLGINANKVIHLRLLCIPFVFIFIFPYNRIKISERIHCISNMVFVCARENERLECVRQMKKESDENASNLSNCDTSFHFACENIEKCFWNICGTLKAAAAAESELSSTFTVKHFASDEALKVEITIFKTKNSFDLIAVMMLETNCTPQKWIYVSLAIYHSTAQQQMSGYLAMIISGLMLMPDLCSGAYSEACSSAWFTVNDQMELNNKMFMPFILCTQYLCRIGCVGVNVGVCEFALHRKSFANCNFANINAHSLFRCGEWLDLL